MPLDYDALTNGVAQARDQGHSDEEIFQHLASKNKGFKEALDAGYELQDVLDHLQSKQPKGGEQNEDEIQNQSEANLGGNARRASDQQVAPERTQEGAERGSQARLQPYGSERVRSDDSSQGQRNGDSFQLIGGENTQGGELNANEENAKAEDGYGSQVRQEDGQGIRSQEDARKQAQVKSTTPEETGVQSAFSKVRDFGATALSSIGQSIYGALSGLARTEPEYIELPSYGTKIKNPRFEDSKELVDFFERQKEGASDIEALGAKPLTGAAKTAAEVTGGLLKLPAQALTGPLGFASMIGEAFGSQKDAVYQKAKQQGLSDEDALNKANFEATASTAATLPLYYIGGKIAGASADKLVSETAPKLAQVATRFGLNAVANSVASAASRGVTAALSGESITDAMKNVDAPGVIQDIAFAAHSTATHFQEQAAQGNAKQAARDLPDPILEQVAQDPRYADAVAPEVKARAESRVAQQAEQTNLPETAQVLETTSETERVATPEPTAEAIAEAQPTEPSETKEQVKETSGIPAEQGKPPVGETAVKAEEGTPQREGEGKEGEVVPEGARIASAAYLAPDGNIYEGADHIAAMEKAKEAGAISQADIDAKQSEKDRNTSEFGFKITLPDGTTEITTREVAGKIAKQSGQALVDEFVHGDKLHSNEIIIDEPPSNSDKIPESQNIKVDESSLPTKEEQAKSIREKRKNQGGFVDESILKDVYEYGVRILKKGMQYGAWAKKMISDLGSAIKNVLGKIWSHYKNSRFASEGGSLGSASDDFAKRVAAKKKDPLVELSEKIKASSTAKPKTNIVDLSKTAQSIADQVSKGKDAVTKGIANVRGAFEATKNAYLNAPKWNDFKQAIGQWSLADNQTSLKVRKAITDLKKAIPDPLKREAITNWIQAGGDEALLRERANASKPKYKKGYESALKLTDEEKSHAQNISKYLSDMLEEGINSGMLNHGIENYITQVWKKENPVTRKLQASLQGGKLNKNFQFAKKRVFDSYFEGEQAGYEPASKDVASLIASYDLSFRKTQAVRAFVKSMTEGKAEDGKPLVQLSGYAQPVSEEGQPPSAYLIKPQARSEGAVSADGRPYVSINHPAFKGWKWTMNGPDGKPVLMESDMLVHPDVASQIKNITSTSWFKANKIPVLSNAIDTLLKFSSILKQTKLSLSLFHLNQEGLHSIFHRINPANLKEIDLNDPVQSNLVSHGLQIADYNSQELFSEGLAGGGLVGKIPVIGRMQNWFNDFLFKDFIPKLKMNMATHALERNVERYSKKLSMDQIYELTAAQSNAAFGELNYKFMARNQTMQDMMRLFLLAPDFLEARSRFVAQALKPYGAEQRAALALMGVSLYAIGRVLNQVLDQNPHWDKPFSIFHEGREYRLRTVLGDVSELVEKPNTFFMNRLSPFGRSGVEFLTGRDARGIKRSAIEQVEDFLSWFVPIPAQTQPSSTTSSEILSSIGLSNYQHMEQTDVYDKANKWLKQQASPKIQAEVKKREQATMAESSYKQLKSALLAGNMDFAAKEYNRLIKEEGKTKQDFDRAFRVNRPFTGSFANEKQFTSKLDNKERIKYNKAIKERNVILQRLQQLQGLK